MQQLHNHTNSVSSITDLNNNLKENMAAKPDRKLFIDELCKRWGKEMDQVLDLAIAGSLALWIEFSEVSLHPRAKDETESGAFLPPGKFYRKTAVRPLPEELSRMQGRNDRMIIVLELRCRDAKGREMTLTNSVGEEWGDASMFAIKPANLFARPDEVARFERQQGMATGERPGASADAPATETGEDGVINAKDHPCHSEELAIALACWQALFADAEMEGTRLRKGDIVGWLGEQYPHLPGAAAERIASVVLPAKKSGKVGPR